MFLASHDHADVPHVLYDYHVEGGSKKPEKLEAKVGHWLDGWLD